MVSKLICVLVIIGIVNMVLGSPVDTDKPAFSCPEDEMYYKCSQIACYKVCDHLKNGPACPSVTPDCYNPACECKQDHLRNAEGKCIPWEQCPK